MSNQSKSGRGRGGEYDIEELHVKDIVELGRLSRQRRTEQTSKSPNCSKSKAKPSRPQSAYSCANNRSRSGPRVNNLAQGLPPAAPGKTASVHFKVQA